MKLLANPVLTRELRGRIRGKRALAMLVVYLSIIAVVTLLIYMAVASSFRHGINDPAAGPGREVGKAIFFTVMIVSLIQVCIITPSLTAGAISGERERQSYDLLMTTLLSPLQIALGKLTSALAFALLLIFAALPMAGLSFLFGGVSGMELLIGIAGLVVTAICYATVGLFWSSVMRTTLAATVMAQGSVILILLAVPFILTISTILLDPVINFDSPLFIYSMGFILCLHPFIALGASAVMLGEGEGPFYFTMTSTQGDLLVPAPWLAYIAISLVLTLICLALAVRMLQPGRSERVAKAKRPKQAQAESGWEREG
ncbi:ABC transporter permease [Candidatus Viridilinea mediisalina]|uniref:ABC transporter permease n=1 Tax=Candidatus Viridilinea mediisalina TaxID=2024553 RepID=UPI000F595A34|nr:ABC transporter permease subunit [Candidatus Viridilinea mediisalina]